MKRKWLAIGIILIFIGTCIIPAMAQDTEKSQSTSRGKWLYVGGSGPGNYTRIQDAIDNASDGDTVFVYRGIYCDYNVPEWGGAAFYINKSINLVGENKFTTIIDGGLEGNRINGLICMANWINISGFTIQNCHSAAIKYLNSFNISIYNNILKNNYYGIESYAGPFILYNNTICNNKYGILIESQEFSIFNNIIENNSIGIQLTGRWIDIHHNLIRYNTIGILSKNGRARIHENNCIQNIIQANFSNCLNFPYFIFLGRSNWASNYWDNWLVTFPKPIRGNCWYEPQSSDIIGFVSLQFDWHPAQEPYDISGMR